jgi:hypothetical protein
MTPAHTRLARLLWLDCTAGLLAGVSLFVLAPPMERLLGLPLWVTRINATANLVYGAYSLSLATRARPPLAAVGWLTRANLAWAALCATAAAGFALHGAGWAAGYLFSEGVFVGGLALVEQRTLAAARNELHCERPSVSESGRPALL